MPYEDVPDESETLSQRIAELRELERKATPGPWVHGPMGIVETFCDTSFENAELIAEIRNALPCLLDAADEVIRLRAENERLRKGVERLANKRPFGHLLSTLQDEISERIQFASDLLEGK